MAHFANFGDDSCSGDCESPSASRFRFPGLLVVEIGGEVDTELLSNTTEEMNSRKTAPGGRTACA